MKAGERSVVYMPLQEIRHAPRNPKAHDGDGIGRSIGRFGVAELPLLDERTGRLVAGHGRLDQLTAMHAEGSDPPDGIRLADDDWLIPVVRGWASRSDAEAEAYLIASNQLTIAGGWDEASLGAVLADLAEVDASLLDLVGFDDDDLAALLATDDGPGDGDTGEGGSDDVPEPPPEPASVLGDVWLLGRHRLMCGDSLNPQHLDQALAGQTPGIVYTDPPYGISIVGESGKVGHHTGMPFGGLKGTGRVIETTAYLPVAGDASTETAGDAFRLLMAAYPAARHVWWGGNHYASSAGLPDSSCWLVWDKATNGNFADAELAWTNHDGAVRLLSHMWNGMLRATERGKRVHPTQKPVALVRWAFSVVDPKHERAVVLDAFGGSGSTLIAAHETDRTAVVLELEPAYVDVICARYQRLTGELPILEATDEAHDFVGEVDQVGATTSDASDR